MNGLADGRTNEGMYGRIDGRIDEWMYESFKLIK